MPFGRPGIGNKKRGPIKEVYNPSNFSTARKLGSKLRMKTRPPGMPNPGLGKIKL